MVKVLAVPVALDPVCGMRVNPQLVSDHSLILGVMSGDQDNVLREAFVLAMLAAGP